MKHLNCTKILDTLLSLLALVVLSLFLDSQPAHAVTCNSNSGQGSLNCQKTDTYVTWEPVNEGKEVTVIPFPLQNPVPSYSLRTQVLTIPRVCVVNHECYTEVEVTGFTVLKATQEAPIR